MRARWRTNLKVLLVMLAGFALWSTQVPAQEESARRWWSGADLGSAAVNSLVPAPSAGRKAVAASVEFGFRVTPELGLGLEYGGVLPLGGCAEYGCGNSAADFAPNFTRLSAFGEFHPRGSRWRFRAGAGMSRFCYGRYWSESAWGWQDTVALVLLGDDDPEIDGTGAWRCDARMKALGGAASVGYDWSAKVQPDGTLWSVGWRLSAEVANFEASPAMNLPAFRHRAVMLTLHLRVN